MSVISAFLAPYKVYAYGALAAAVIGAGLYYTYHERHIGAKEEVAVVDKASAKQEVIERKASNTAAASEAQASTLYDETNRAPPPAQLPIECVRHDQGGVPVQNIGTTSGAASASKPAADGAVGSEYNPSGPALERGKEADAQIIYLQARVALLEKLIADANK
jgi:hypothetical protein